MHQFLQLVSNNTTPLPTARWKLSDNNIKPQSSDLVSLGYFKNLKESIWELSVETYYRRTQDMIDYISGANLQLNPTIETQLLNGKGLAYGAELMLTKKKERLQALLDIPSLVRFRKLMVNIQNNVLIMETGIRPIMISLIRST
jgi:hypothetical protein